MVLPPRFGIGLAVALALWPAAAGASKPRLRLEYVDRARCAARGEVQLHLVELELEGNMRPAPRGGYRLLLDGKPLPGRALRRATFAGVPRPLLVALVMQNDSAYEQDLSAVKTGARAFVRRLPPRAKVTVIAYAQEVQRQLSLGSPKQALAAIKRVKPVDDVGGVELVEAIKMGLRGVAAGEAGARRMVVVVSDGRNETAKRDLFRALGSKAQQDGIPIYPIAFSPIDERVPLLNLGEIAKRSRGTFRWARQPTGIGEQFANLAQEINQQQVLTFRLPDACARAHTLQVLSGRLRSNSVKVPAVKLATGGRRVDGAGAGGGSATVLWVALGGGGLLLAAAVLVLGIVLSRRRSRKPQPQPPQPQPQPQPQPEPQPEPPPQPQPPEPQPEPQPQPPELQPLIPELGGPAPYQPPAAGAVRFVLQGVSAQVAGWRVELREGTALVGTAADCAVRLSREDGVAIYHAELQLQHGRLLLEDLESGAPVWVNGHVVKHVSLRDGDTLQLGRVQFVVRSARGA
jgi:pSer/pThr/pTyr-binding forkhead associated (FHA) protein